MNKNVKRIISILLTFVMIVSMASVVFAGVAGKVPKPNDVTGKIGEATTIRNRVLGFVQWVGYAFAVGMLIYIGIKYVMASANEKADLKKGAINYVIGAIIVFGFSLIIGALSTMGENITKAG